MMFGKWIGVAAAAAAVLAGCADNPIAPQSPPDLPAGVQLQETSSGLQFADIRVGTGARAATGNTVAVHYTGWLEDGTRFDTSMDRTPLTFVVGRGDVIPGWHEGIRGMRVGGTRRLVIPPHLAYRDRNDVPGIPPGSTLIFDVTLRAVQ